MIGLGLALGLGSAAVAQDGPPGECFDVSAEARILKQTYTDIPPCDDCIVMRWPWLIDLDIRRVRLGSLPTGRLQVQSVQHTYIRDDRTWRVWLRRNSDGGYNLIGMGADALMERCPASGPPAQPYIGRTR